MKRGVKRGVKRVAVRDVKRVAVSRCHGASRHFLGRWAGALTAVHGPASSAVPRGVAAYRESGRAFHLFALFALHPRVPWGRRTRELRAGAAETPRASPARWLLCSVALHTCRRAGKRRFVEAVNEHGLACSARLASSSMETCNR